MTTSGVFNEEHSLPTPKKPDAIEKSILTKSAEILWSAAGLFERWRNEMMESRRYQDPRNQDPDYSRRLRELEGQIQDIDREQRGFRMGDYHESGGKETSWKDWVLGLVGLLIVAWLGRISLQMETLQATIIEQKMMEKHMESTDSRVDRLETRVYRGAQ
jgi:hypothetical protein